MTDHIIIPPGAGFGLSVESLPLGDAVNEKFRPYFNPRLDVNLILKKFGIYFGLAYPLLYRPYNVQTMHLDVGTNTLEYNDRELSSTDIFSLGVVWRMGPKK